MPIAIFTDNQTYSIAMTDERVIKTFFWFKRAMERNGRKVSFPTGTPPEKTYLYRSLKKFVEKVKDWDLSDDLTIMMIAMIIKWASQKKMLHHGASLLHMDTVLEICYAEMKTQLIKKESVYKEINRCQKFIQENSQPLLILRRGGLTNFTKWYQTGKITTHFIAISQLCQDVLGKLPQHERGEFPTELEFLKKRIHLLSDAESRGKISEIVGLDLLLKGV